MFMKMVSGFLILCCFGLFAFLGTQIYEFWIKARDQDVQYNLLREKFEKLTQANHDIKAKLDLYARPENLEKEMRLRFNYKKPDETMLILVPAPSSSVSSTNP